MASRRCASHPATLCVATWWRVLSMPTSNCARRAMSLPAPSTVRAADAEAPAEPEPAHLQLGISVEAGDWTGIAELEAAIRSAASALGRHPGARGARGHEASIV